MKRLMYVLPFLICCLLLWQQMAQATEGASSYYFPGAPGTFAAAVTPDPGFMMFNQTLFLDSTASKAVLNGRANLNVNADALYNYVGGAYTFALPLLGGRFQIGAAVPIGYEHIEAGIDTALGSRNTGDHNTSLGDSLIAPAIYWQTGDFHFRLTETVYIPTGNYNKDNLVNIGRNYWGLDTSVALSWLCMKTGTEITLIPGIMVNTKNSKTDYQSGNEFHLDFMVNQFLAKTFAVGFQGYYYTQISDDSGSGAKLGGFKGASVGVGPALLWTPDFGKGKLSLIAKWLHDVDHTNRMEGDYGQFIVSYKF